MLTLQSRFDNAKTPHSPFLLTSAVREGEVPRSGTCRSGEAREGRVTFQHVALVTAVADFVADVERGALLVAVGKLSRVSTRVAGQS